MKESLLNAFLHGSNSVFRNKFSRFIIPSVLSLKAQPHNMTYISSHPELFYKRVFLKFLQNSQESSCSGVYFSCIFNKKEALAQLVSCQFSKIGLTWKYQKQMLANVSYESVCFVFIQIKLIVEKFIYYKCCSRFKMSLRIKNIITQILFIAHLINKRC